MNRLEGVFAVTVGALLTTGLAAFLLGPTPAPTWAPADAGRDAVSVHPHGTTAANLGSAVVLTPHYILTNAHVVTGAGEHLVVRGQDGREQPARVVWVSADDALDAALLRVEAPLAERRADLRCTDPEIGEPLLAYGFAGMMVGQGVWGYRAWGHVSSAMPERVGWITNAAYLPGMSGGPVYDARGRVVGLVTALLGSQTPFGQLLGHHGASILTPVSALCARLEALGVRR